MQWIADNAVVILGVLLGISEILGTFDYFKSSSVFGVIVGWIKKLKDMVVKK